MARRKQPGVRKLESGRFQARPSINGRQISLGTFSTAREAQQAIEQARVDARTGSFVSPSDGHIPLRPYATEWLEGRLGIADGTRASYKVTINMLGWLGDVMLSDLTPTHVKRRIAEWAADLAPNTVALRHTHLKTILSAAVHEQRLVRNPASHPSIELPRGGNVKARRYLTYDEVSAVTNYLPTLYADMTWTLVWGGFRYQEAAGLDRTQIDLDAGRFRLSRQWNPKAGRHGPLKGRADEVSVRHTPIAAELRPILERRLAMVGPGLLFPSPSRPGMPPALASYQDAVDKACEASGVERFTSHDGRHTCSSWLHAVGVSIEEAAVWLGHRDSTITAKVYTHLWPSQMESAADKLAGIRSVDLGAGVTRLRKAEG